MILTFDVPDPKFHNGDQVLSIYMGTGELSYVLGASIAIWYVNDNSHTDQPHWCYRVPHSGKERMLDERDVYSLTQIEQDIEDLGIEKTAKKYRIDMKYIELCNDYIQQVIAEHEADGQSEALSS